MQRWPFNSARLVAAFSYAFMQGNLLSKMLCHAQELPI
jgi:hypothetical protein